MLITAGVVVLADAGLTLVWQEPLSAAYGSIKQGQAEDELNDLEAEYPTAADLAAIAGVEGTAAKGLKSGSPGAERKGWLPVTALEPSRPSSGRKRGGAVG